MTAAMTEVTVPTLPDPRVRDRLWRLFSAIVRRWSDIDPTTMKSNWLVFLGNRIRVDASYAGEYAAAAQLLDEMAAAMGEEAAYEKLLTDAQANVAPPATPLARARQRVSNEFITLFLALGGFKAYGAVNYLGYIGGANIEGQIPYRTASAPGAGSAA